MIMKILKKEWFIWKFWKKRGGGSREKVGGGNEIHAPCACDYDSLRDVRKKNKKNDRIVNIDKEKYEINSLHVYSCYDFICKEISAVRLSKNQCKSTVYTHNSYNM
jgi:hypothetical protein